MYTLILLASCGQVPCTGYSQQSYNGGYYQPPAIFTYSGPTWAAPSYYGSPPAFNGYYAPPRSWTPYYAPPQFSNGQQFRGGFSVGIFGRPVVDFQRYRGFSLGGVGTN